MPLLGVGPPYSAVRAKGRLAVKMLMLMAWGTRERDESNRHDRVHIAWNSGGAYW